MAPIRWAQPRACAKWTQTLRASCSARARSYATAQTSRGGRPFRLAIIGSGPAGFYTAYRAMSRIQDAKVDMYEALPVPYGLVRFGVAPDHPEVKNCQEKFEEVASSPNFTFVGNVSVGTPSDHPDGCTVPLASILRHYNAVVFSYGAAKDRTLGIPGESSLKGIYSAREFVGWYNGLPEHADLAPDLTQGDEAVVIGQGNVALDVARMLLEDVDVLRKSDIAEHAIETLSKSKIRRVHIVGRRGPMQAAFTIKEARELMKLPDVAFHPIDQSLIPADPKTLPRAPRRLMDILLKGSPTPPSSSSTSTSTSTATKSWSLDFLLTPQAFHPCAADPARVGSTTFERTALSSPFDPHAYALGTAQTVSLPSRAVFRSIGYRSAPLPEFAALGIPFNERWGVISNDGGGGGGGRVQHEERTAGAAMAYGRFPGLYCAGWVKRGPTGVIASTMEDAFATADAISRDWGSGDVPFLNPDGEGGEAAGWDGVRRETGVGRARVVDWDGWRRIDRAERERGRLVGKEREKFTRTADMLAVLG
ncbi:NADPH:adrenodoxin oxidoreductase-like protein [Trichocladium antarcticum]|uniref:NADPH:adrenodoxin oxidoreductase, mitochondrial n=1 Tax=Trichocladium antarcticum TaxID=1450529 RepID=A0AAN6UJR6_9PEZI|nr:NADPH:adrenodoxin oxidoreductase-like protein [Trichocladium antarcticum]